MTSSLFSHLFSLFWFLKVVFVLLLSAIAVVIFCKIYSAINHGSDFVYGIGEAILNVSFSSLSIGPTVMGWYCGYSSVDKKVFDTFIETVRNTSKFPNSAEQIAVFREVIDSSRKELSIRLSEFSIDEVVPVAQKALGIPFSNDLRKDFREFHAKGAEFNSDLRKLELSSTEVLTTCHETFSELVNEFKILEELTKCDSGWDQDTIGRIKSILGKMAGLLSRASDSLGKQRQLVEGSLAQANDIRHRVLTISKKITRVTKAVEADSSLGAALNRMLPWGLGAAAAFASGPMLPIAALAGGLAGGLLATGTVKEFAKQQQHGRDAAMLSESYGGLLEMAKCITETSSEMERFQEMLNSLHGGVAQADTTATILKRDVHSREKFGAAAREARPIFEKTARRFERILAQWNPALVPSDD